MLVNKSEWIFFKLDKRELFWIRPLYVVSKKFPSRSKKIIFYMEACEREKN
jgi:hypothetical protein